MNFRPTTSHILVRPDPVPERSGCIVLPPSLREKERDKENAWTGVILAEGPGMPMKDGRRWPMPGLVGKRVVYSRLGAHQALLDFGDGETTYDVIRDGGVWAVVEEAGKEAEEASSAA